ncbi:MAG TPA: FAD-dependent monooxygenase [Bacteroidia bacterium]|jgi:2-polyprenyl-6-methoxyphenol hydroxylase-like FAD-dependent oxidoreductase|nr:FAD-dependent monooxygenase [Bacteroidia bacterium]
MKNKNILISGAGIAGLTLAYWLKKHGFNPTIIEQAPKLREGGYVIDFFGAGYDVAEKMGIISDLEKVDIKINGINFVNEKGKRKGGVDTFKVRSMLKNRVFFLLRSKLARVIYENLEKDIPFIYGNSITKIDQQENDVIVTLSNGTVCHFDLVIGADGLHSKVRSLVFGSLSHFESFYGFYASSFTIQNYFGKNDLFLNYTVPGKQVSIYSLEDNKLAALFLFRSNEKLAYGYHDTATQKELLRDFFRDTGWESASLLSKVDTSPDFYFDTVSQIRMDRWYSGRVTLVGDACDCPSLLSGQGSTLAMVGAYILAGELKEAQGDHEVAFSEYQKQFKPLIGVKQDLAKKFASSFIPKSKFALWVRNRFTNLMFIPFVSRWLVKNFMTDPIRLKDY